MKDLNWVEEFSGSVTICDPQGVILDMNQAAAKAYADDGGRDLIGSNILDCHPDLARAKVENMLSTQEANVYTVVQDGLKKMIYQTPWYRNGQYAGFVELFFEIPADVPHFIRA